jgi:hypothetical protein
LRPAEGSTASDLGHPDAILMYERGPVDMLRQREIVDHHDFRSRPEKESDACRGEIVPRGIEQTVEGWDAAVVERLVNLSRDSLRVDVTPARQLAEIEAELPRHYAWRGHVSQVQWLDYADSTHNASTNFA